MSEVQFLCGKPLAERMQYYMQEQGDRGIFESVFSESEWNVLCALQKYEYIRDHLQLVLDAAPAGLTAGEKMVLQLEKIDCEKASIMELRGYMITQLDVLLKQQSVEAWCDMLVWYQYVIQKDLARSFWEFYVFKMMLDIFVAECKACSENGKMPSVIQLHGTKEVLDVYYKTVFLLRRMEYGVEPVDELKEYMGQKGLSPILVHYILKNAQIQNKQKVRNIIEDWC